jgi:NTE family protein
MVSDEIENVLVLQGGGSLGAFGCGVFKAFAKNNIKIHIAAGTSIGGINAAIIAGSRDRPEKSLENFWLELAKNSVDLIPEFLHRTIDLTENYYSKRQEIVGANESLKHMLSYYSSATYGNRRMFLPRWRPEYAISDPEYFMPQNWTYIYDHSPLAKTLEKYIDYNKLRPGGNPNVRLVVTAVNVLTAEPMIFDSSQSQITVKHLLASSGYPLYSFPWVEVEHGVYAWDGSLLSNTPLREVMDVAPVTDKRVFIVENYPKKIDRLPKNMPEVYHRARDIMFSDKTAHNVRMSRVITHYLQFIEELYRLVEKHVDKSEIDKNKLALIKKKYKKIIEEHGSEIKTVEYITREERFPYLYENTDFTPEGISQLIDEGQSKTEKILRRNGLI